MHDLVWGKPNTTSQSKINIIGNEFGHQWEHFIDKLDIKRVQKTIDDFPIWDAVKPTQDLEPWVCKVKDDTTEENSDDEDNQGQSISSSDNSGDEYMATTTKKPNHKVNSSQYEMYSRDEDERYSPGFIMPMILGTLESFGKLVDKANDEKSTVVSDEQSYSRKRSSTDREPEDDFKSDPAKEGFANVAYRLSQNGALSLTVACLSSNCPDLRSIAIAGIYRFLQAIHSIEAQSLVEWKSRSQLQMALSSVQRGLMVIRTKLIV